LTFSNTNSTKNNLPDPIISIISRPILYSFKYAQHPFRLDIAIQKHERLEGISTVIEAANTTVLFLEEGKVIYKIIYTIRNTFKQFMELELPANAGIWTVLVDNKREKASRGKKGKVLIPLVRSPGNGEQLKSFNVELIYSLSIKKFGFSGSSQCLLPGSDIFINKMRITMFMPDGFNYHFEKGEWKEEKTTLPGRKRKDISRPIKLEELKEAEEKPQEAPGVTGGVEGFGFDDESDIKEKSPPPPAKPIIIPKEITAKQGVSPRLQVLTGPVGLDSIKVHLPLSGTKYLFSKKIIDKNETYPLKFSYFNKNLRQGIIYLIIFTVFVVLLILFIRKIKRKK
jgi:hypothetical protein